MHVALSFPPVPLAVSGLLVIGLVVLASLVLLWVLLRGEAEYEDNEQPEQGGAPAQPESYRGERPWQDEFTEPAQRDAGTEPPRRDAGAEPREPPQPGAGTELPKPDAGTEPPTRP
jgi:hypothetical protein